MLFSSLKFPSQLDISQAATISHYRDGLDNEAAQLYDGSRYAKANGGGRKIFVTLATPDYHWGLVTLIRSLRQHSDNPIFVLMVSPWDFKTEEPDVFMLQVPNLLRVDPKRQRNEFSNTFAKLWAFGLYSFARVVFVDSDVLVTGRFDELFESDQFLVCRDSVDWCRQDQFNSGVMAFSPNTEMFGEIIAKGATAESVDGGDQGLLNTLFRGHVQFVGSEFNTTRHYWYLGAPELDGANVRAMHFIVKKPWELHYRELPDALLLDLDDKWTEFLTHTELKSLVRHWRRRQFLVERSVYDATRQTKKDKRRRKRTRIIASAFGAVLVTLSLGFALGHYI